MTGSHHPRLGPVRFRYWNDLARAETLRTVGYRASCGCGWSGKVQESWEDARADAQAHQRQERGTNHSSPLPAQ